MSISTSVHSHVQHSFLCNPDFFDYSYYESAFNISGGERTCHNIELLNDTFPEDTELFALSLSSSNSEATPSQALVKIYDDDGKEGSCS